MSFSSGAPSPSHARADRARGASSTSQSFDLTQYHGAPPEKRPTLKMCAVPLSPRAQLANSIRSSAGSSKVDLLFRKPPTISIRTAREGSYLSAPGATTGELDGCFKSRKIDSSPLMTLWN